MSPEAIISITITFILGILSGVLLSYFKLDLQRHFKNKERKETHKINIARNLQKVVTEASTNHFRLKPRDPEHVHSVLDDVKGIDADISEKANIFVGDWQVMAHLWSTKGHGKEQQSNIEELRNLRDELIDWCNKVKNT